LFDIIFPRVDDAADILDDQIVQQLDAARPGVDRHMRRRRPISIGQLVVVGESSVDPQTVRRQFGEGNRAAAADAGAAIHQLDFISRAAKPSGGRPPDLFEQCPRTLEHRRAAEDRRARVKRAVPLLQIGGRAMEHAHLVERNAKRIDSRNITAPCAVVAASVGVRQICCTRADLVPG
jgi:hypothetical protein